MLYAVHYRLRPECLRADHDLLDAVYRELAVRRPAWLSCRTFRAAHDATMMMFLLEPADIERLAELPCLAVYLQDLESRCETEPRAGSVDERGVPEDGSSVAHWDPDAGSCALPRPAFAVDVPSARLSAETDAVARPSRTGRAAADPPAAARAARDRR